MGLSGTYNEIYNETSSAKESQITINKFQNEGSVIVFPDSNLIREIDSLGKFTGRVLSPEFGLKSSIEDQTENILLSVDRSNIIYLIPEDKVCVRNVIFWEEIRDFYDRKGYRFIKVIHKVTDIIEDYIRWLGHGALKGLQRVVHRVQGVKYHPSRWKSQQELWRGCMGMSGKIIDAGGWYESKETLK